MNKDVPRKEVVKFIKFAKKSLKTGKKCALDIGCGEGRHCDVLASQGFFVYGVDISRNSLKIAKKRNAHHKKHIRFINGDICKIHLPNNFFDVVIDNGDLHFLDRKRREIYYRLIPRVMKKGGFYFLMVFSHSDALAKSKPLVKKTYSTYEIKKIFRKSLTPLSFKEKIIDVRDHKHRMVEFYGRRK